MKNIPHTWVGRTNIIKMTKLPKLLQIFNAMPIKVAHLIELVKKCLNCYRRDITQKILSNSSKTAGITSPDFMLYYKAAVIKVIWNWQKKYTYGTLQQMEGSSTNFKHISAIRSLRNGQNLY